MTLRIEQIKHTNRDTLYVVEHMRDEDREELWALSRTTPDEAVSTSVKYATEAYVAYGNDIPIAVFGAVVPAIRGTGVPWLMGTRGVDRYAREYIKLTRKFSAHLLKQCDALQNVALASNRRTLSFLSRAGFAMSEPFTTITGAEAVLFEMRGTDV